ncbi:MAG: hypothetical protein HN855_09170 [Anaerolineae bacterium]|nr:hypothetical protein [Anaerolineae bacterium]MBT7325316.1 hypothetical protein [Anaerolineae bacterium]
MKNTDSKNNLMPDNTWNIETATKTKSVAFIVLQPKATTSLVEYLSNISDLKFTAHASEFRFSNAHYYRGSSSKSKALIVPTQTLSSIPRKYRKPNWFYLKIFCHPDDLRFETLPTYEHISVPSDKYRV